MDAYTVENVEYINLVRSNAYNDHNISDENISNSIIKENNMYNNTDIFGKDNKNNENEGYRIEVYLKPGVEPGGRDFAIYKILGYSNGMEFYSPVYDTPERKNNPRPDNRTTLYWNPYVQTDTTGKGFVEFYTDDREDAELEITIEGVTPSGTPVLYRTELNRKDEK